MSQAIVDTLLAVDQQHIWHPYSSMTERPAIYPVSSADGVRLRLSDGNELIDGMSSWWCMIHGYNHPVLNQALAEQSQRMSHVMFGGLTHEPATTLAQTLAEITPPGLEHIFFSDSGSVAVEVAMKMALQYWHAANAPSKHRFLTIRKGYHGDTFAAMSVCDPVTGMHSLFSQVLPQQVFAPEPEIGFDEPWDPNDISEFSKLLAQHRDELAAVILEPIVQGAGGMRFYSPEYLKTVRALCDEHNVLLIADEIATGFGRTGKLFACEHAGISPDILCLGKALTGGYLTLAATLTTAHVSSTICNGEAGAFMHGPTFMGNPLACSVANASLKLLLESDWQTKVQRIEKLLKDRLAPARDFAHIKDVRCLGGIGVLESHTPVRMNEITQAFVDRGVWVRPFGTRVYIMPPFVIEDDDLLELADTLVEVTENPALFQ